MNKLLVSAFGVSTVAIASLAVSTSAQALNLFTSCSVPSDINSNNYVTGVSDCNYLPDGSQQQDFLGDPMTVNEREMFEKSDWSFLDKYEYDDNGSGSWEKGGILGATIGGNRIEGNWSFSDLANYEHVAMLFNDGNGTALTTYLLSSTEGLFKNPFYSPSGILVTDKEISHVSFYVRETSQPVPEPLTILGTGLALGLGGLFKSKQQQKYEV